MSMLTLLHRNIKWRFNNRFTIVFTILQPILWLILYSTVAGQTMQGIGIQNYTAFIMPGLVVLVSFGACSSSDIINYLMKADGSFYRILIAPVKRSSIVLGQMLEAVLCTFLEVIIIVSNGGNLWSEYCLWWTCHCSESESFSPCNQCLKGFNISGKHCIKGYSICLKGFQDLCIGRTMTEEREAVAKLLEL